MLQNIVPINIYICEKKPVQYSMPNLSLAIHQSQSSNVTGVHLASTAQNLVTLFLEGLRSSMSEDNKNQGDRWPIYAKHLLSSLETLLPDGKLQSGYDSRQSLITEDEIFQTKFNQLLVFSIANNFAGLQDVPVQCMLKYWSRAGGMVSLLLQSLQASQSHFAKALAQNLFRAAIEANDERALKRLLSIGSLDVNTTMCIVNGEKYTPVERAAYLQELGIVELLLIAKADVNKTFCFRGSRLRNALGKFISGCRATTPETFELGELLLRAGRLGHGYGYIRIIHGWIIWVSIQMDSAGYANRIKRHLDFFVCVIRVYPVTQPSSDIFLDGYPPVKALDTTRITQCPSLYI